MQRWSLILSAYDYAIEYVSGTSNCCVDCMSRLPLPDQPVDSAEKQHVLVQTEEPPVTASQIAKESLVVCCDEICSTRPLASYLNSQLDFIS